MKEEKVFNIEFSEIIGAVKRRFYIVILITLPLFLFGVYYGNSSTRVMYQASSSLIVGRTINNEGAQIQIEEVSRIQSFMETYCAIARTTAVSEKTIEKLKINITPEVLKSFIVAIPQEGTPFIELRLTWPKREEAILILDALTEVYIREAKNFSPAYDIRAMEKSKIPNTIISTNKTMYTFLGLASGLILSILVIFAIEFMNDCLRTEKDIYEYLELPVIGAIPVQKKRIWQNRSNPVKKAGYAVMEAFRTLRTNIYFTSLIKIHEPQSLQLTAKVQTIALTSGMPGEGKTTAAVLLGAAMAQDGKKTIIVDCNMRKPDIHNLFSLKEIGLSNVFERDVTWENAVSKTEIHNLYVIPAGFKPDNPAELLSSPTLKTMIEELRSEFDYIIIDTPPVVMVTDAQVLSQIIDAYLLIVASGESSRELTLKAKRLIQHANGRILGVVLTKIRDIPAYRCYSGYQKKNVKQQEQQIKGDTAFIADI